MLKLHWQMKNLIFSLVIIIVVIVLYQVPQLVQWVFQHNSFRQYQLNQSLIQRIFDALGILVVLLYGVAITYKRWWSTATFKRIGTNVIFFVIFICFFWLVKEAYAACRNIDRLYDYYKKGNGIVGNVFMADDSLGHRGVPNGNGKSVYFLYGIPQSVPLTLNSEGFRALSHQESDSLMLFLGCSFTWGDYCPVEKTYVNQVTNLLKINGLNYGVNAYGLAQMLLLAERMIPKHRPHYVVVQYSPWLTDRARFMFYPSAYGSMPYPFVAQNEQNKLYIHQPYFLSSLYNVDYQYFKKTPESFFDKMTFYGKVGFPVVVVDGLKKYFTILGIKFGFLPVAEHENQKIEQYVYERIYQLCEQYHAQMLVLNLGGFGYSNDERIKNHYDRARFLKTMYLKMTQHCIFVDADSVLRAGIGPHQDYSKYLLWGKISAKDSVIYDYHPNALAHRIIAESLVKGLNKK